MKSQRKIGSFCAALLILGITFTSVVGYQTIQSNETNPSSPLFTIRTQQAIPKINEKSITPNYLGKGNTPTLFPASSSEKNKQIDKMMNMIYTNPTLVQKLLDKLVTFPQIKHLLQQYQINKIVLQQILTQMKENPGLLKDQLNKINYPTELSGDSQPLGLDTSSVIGCFVTILILLPIAILIAVLIATILIITCFNLGNCLETLLQAILNGMLQNINQP